MNEKYLNINHSVLYNPTFTSDEKIILAEIISLDKLRNRCIASDNHFAKIINKSRTTTNGIIKKLESKGFITIEVKQGIGKTTKPVENFWELIKSHVQIQDTSETNLDQKGVQIQDITCQDSLQVGVENDDTTSRDLDTTITSNNTEIIIQKELQDTGANNQNLDKTIGNQNLVAHQRILELFEINPKNISNSFLLEFMDSLAGPILEFGWDFINRGEIFKSNIVLIQKYGNEKFMIVQQDLIFAKKNMNRFLQLKKFI